MDLFTPFIVRPKAEPEAKKDIAIKKISAMPKTRKLSDKRKELSLKNRQQGVEPHVVAEGELVGIDADAEDLTYDAHGHTQTATEDNDQTVAHIDVEEDSLLNNESAQSAERAKSAANNVSSTDAEKAEDKITHWDDWV